MRRRFGILSLGLALGLWLPAGLQGQAVDSPPMIDTVIVLTQNVFTPEVAEKNAAFRVMNGIHITTKHDFIWAELLFRAGEPYDSIKIEESERNLRSREIFKRISIDSVRLGDRLAVIVDSQDGWTLKPKFKLTIASDGSWSGQFGVAETNLFGTGNLASLIYLKEPDRHGPELAADFRRLFGTHLGASGKVVFWDDGTDGNWRFGVPFLSTLETRSLEYDGESADRRILQYRVDDAGTPDTTFYRRDALINRITGALALLAESSRYFRVGVKAETRREGYAIGIGEDSVPPTVPDSLYGELGLFGEYSQTRYKEVRLFNGFGSEDINISTTIRFTANLAPGGWGYERTGFGPRLDFQTGLQLPDAFLQTSLRANGLYSGAGLDSGQVVVDLTFGAKVAPRHSTVLYVTAGWQENPAPGQEFDLGFETPPRSFEPHAFVGTRMLWGTAEHRWFVWDEIFNLISLGLAGFVDYGGAWYPDQDPRFGGNIGIGLRQGSALSTAARTGRLDLGYKFGKGVTGDRWVLTFGAGFVFPWRPQNSTKIGQ